MTESAKPTTNGNGVQKAEPKEVTLPELSEKERAELERLKFTIAKAKAAICDNVNQCDELEAIRLQVLGPNLFNAQKEFNDFLKAVGMLHAVDSATTILDADTMKFVPKKKP